jgi:hypothetical protein
MRVSTPERTGYIQIAALTAVASLACAVVRAQPQAESSAGAGAVSAVWAPKQLTFDYRGFTAIYSCDGLREKMRRILLRLGARADLQVRGYGCTRLAGPDSLAGVSIKMNILQPAGNQSGQAVPAHWKMVDLLATHQPVDEEGNCELIEQIRQKVLPLFATRNVDYSSTCVPRQVNIGTTRLKAEVLVADQ